MKKTLILCFLLLNAVSLFSLQDERLDEFSFESSELKHESTPYFAIAGGATFTFQFANFDAVNQHLITKGFDVGEFSGQVNLWGGEGFTGVVYIPNMRIGFLSYGGSKILSKDYPAGDEPGFKREVEYSVGITGVSLEYAYVPLKSFAIIGGVSVGQGSLELNTYQTQSESDWNNYDPATNQFNFLNTAASNFWFIKPNVHFEYAITNFLMFRVGLSYNYTMGYDWTLNNSSTLKNVPDDFNANALQIQTGIFLGLFNF